VKNGLIQGLERDKDRVEWGTCSGGTRDTFRDKGGLE